ncbi:MAG TPA: Ig-like domain-containing protein [Jiangellaceae bacterium]
MHGSAVGRRRGVRMVAGGFVTALMAGTALFSAGSSWAADTADDSAAGLTVLAPVRGQTLASARPTFAGTGQDGASVSITVGDDVVATTDVGPDGAWSATPADALPAGRFDALVTQTVGTSTTSMPVRRLGVPPGPPRIASPSPDDEVGPDHVFTGTGLVGATISLSVQAVPVDDAGRRGAAKNLAITAAADTQGTWEVTLPGPMPRGEHTVTATQSVDDLGSEPSATIAFRVGEPAGDEGGAVGGGPEGDLAETGSAFPAMIVAALGALLAGAAVIVSARPRTRI